MRTLASNVLTIAGFGAVIYGVSLWSVPAAIIAGGVLAVVAAINLARGK